MRSNDRILVIRPVEGKHVISNYGLIDKRLFTGEVNIHAIRGPFDNFWRLKAEHGLLPEPLKAQWTTFKGLLDFTRHYYSKRNLEIKEVIDDYESRFA